MSTELSSRFAGTRHVPLLVGLLFLAGLVILFLFWPGTAGAPGVENAAASSAPEPPSHSGGDAIVEPAVVPAGSAPEAVPSAPVDQSGYLRVAGTVPLKGELLTDRMVIFFSEPIQVAGYDPSNPVPPFTMSPPFAGTFTVGDNYLDIRSNAFPKDQIVNVELGDAIRSRSGRALASDRRQLTFVPFRLQALRVWPLESESGHEVIGASFAATVSPEAVKAHTVIKTLDGKDVPFTAEQGTSPSIVRLVVTDNPTWPVSVTFAKGLPDASNSQVLEADQNFTYPADMSLAVNKVDWDQVDEDAQTITVSFSKPVSSNDLKERLTVRNKDTGDPVAYEVEDDVTSENQTVTVHLGQPAKTSLVLEFAQGLSGEGHTVLAQESKVDLVARALQEREPLQVDDQWWSQEGREGLSLNLGFNEKVEAAQLKAFIHITPEVPGLQIEPGYNGRHVQIKGDWMSETSYEIAINPGMIYGDDAKLDRALSRVVTTEKISPYLGFAQEDKYYFPRRGGLDLPLEARAVRKVRIALYRMFPSNIAVAVGDINDGQPWDQFINSWSQFVTQKDMDVTFSESRLKSTPLGLDGLMPADKHGVFCLQASDISPSQKTEDDGSDGEYYYQRTASPATKLVLFTNIGVLSHWLDDELVVFTHDLYSLAPLDLAKVTVYSRKNQVLGTANTDAQGMAHLKSFDTSLGTPAVVVVEKGEDYTFLELTPRTDDIREDMPEMPAFDRDAYDAFLYADRELYRPGETVHLRWIARTHYGDALGNVPLVYTVTKPNGQDLASEPTTLSELGTGGVDLATQKSYPTGKYTVTLKVPGTNKPVGTYQFSLEEFVPNRIKASVNVAESQWLSGQEYTIQVNAQHLFGAPAASRKCEAKVVLRPGVFRPEAWKSYTFSNDSTFKTDLVSIGEEQTDAQGNAAFQFKYQAPATATFPLSALVVGRVFELGGRAVAATKELTLFPSDTCLGITATTPEGRRGVEVHVAAVRPDGAPAALKTVKVTLEKQVWNYYVRRYYNYHQPNWSESFDEVETRDVPLAEGKGSTTFQFDNYGYYRVRVHSADTPQYSTLSFYSYGGEVNLVDAARASLIKLTLDKERYTVGQEAEVRIEAPFDGKGFVVLQGQEIQRMAAVDIKDGVGTAHFMITREQYPNVWVEATVVHAIKEGRNQVYPFSSFAMQSLAVDEPARSLAVSFPGLPEQVLPAQPATFEIETKDSGGKPASVEVTLAAVDEGIHSITGYKSPDPVAYLARPRRADYRRAHYYDKVAYDFDKTPIGGDLEALIGKRAAAVDENWIKPVALWSGVIHTDENGRAKVTMDVPEFSGQLRLVAVAVSPVATGSQTGYVYVRRPHTLQTSMPRFLLPGDRATCRAVLFNNTDAPCKAAVSWASEGTLVAVTGSQEVDVAAHAEASVLADFAAAEAVGQGAINWTAVFKDASGAELDKVTEKALVPVRTPAAYQSDHELVILKPGESTTVRNTKFLDDARSSVDVSVSANPQMRLEDALKYVVGYPYGCVEQTTSRLMPMYLLKQSAALTGLALPREQTLDGYIQSGIDRLFSMQTEDGGLGFWPGAREPYDYGSVYALHFLTLVKNGRDYPLPEKNFEDLQKYVRGLSEDWSQSDFPSLYKRAYAVYVLALGGDLEAIKQIRRFDDVKIPTSARYLLAAALAQNTQDSDRVKMYLSKSPSEPYTVFEPYGTLNSEIRNTAVELMALRQMKGDPKEMARKADALLAFLKDHRYGNTQETAFIVTALGGYLADIAANAANAAGTVKGPKGETKITGSKMYHAAHDGAGGEFTVTNTGAAPLYVNATTGGIPLKVDTEPIVKGLTVSREIYTGEGQPFEGAAYEQSDSYVVGITLKCEQDADNLVVADLIPAGFEIENPRLEPDAIPAGPFEDAATPSFLEIRDDRLVVAFDKLESGEHHFYYVVRAVTPGTYQYPAVEAECMYDASVRGRGALSTVEVAKRP